MVESRDSIDALFWPVIECMCHLGSYRIIV